MAEASPTNMSAITEAADLRRLAVTTAGTAVAGAVVCALIGHPVAGVFFAVGLLLGLLNAYLLRRSAGMYATVVAPQKSRFALGALGRLALISMIALVIAWYTLPDGLAVLAGLAVFQLVMIVVTLIPLLRDLRESGNES